MLNNHISQKIVDNQRHPYLSDNFQGRNISLRLLKRFSSVGSPLSTSSGSSPPHTSPSENKEYFFLSKFGRGKILKEEDDNLHLLNGNQ